MPLDIQVAIGKIAQSISLLTDQQMLYHIICMIVHVIRCLVLDQHNAFEHVDLAGAALVKGRVSYEQFVRHNSKGPHIDGLVVSFGHDDFRCEHLGGSAQSVRLFAHDFGESQIDNLAIALLVDENIFKLQVSVRDLSLVKVSQRFNDARRVECGSGVGETPPLLLLSVQHRVELTAHHEW